MCIFVKVCFSSGSVLVGAMLEQQDVGSSSCGGEVPVNDCAFDCGSSGDGAIENGEDVDCGGGGGSEGGGDSIRENGPLDEGISKEVESEENGDVGGGGGGGGDSGNESSTTATTTVRIHTTYKKRASKFMNRPNVQNGLGTNSLLHPYGGVGGTSGGGGLGGGGGGSSRLFGTSSNLNSSSGNLNSSNSLFGGGGGSRRSNRSLTTRNSLFGGGGESGASSRGGFVSPHPNGVGEGASTTATTASSTTATTVESRPPFVTTVTRGRFLPSKFDLMVEKSLFTFSSRPKPVGLITKHHCTYGSGPLKENSSQNCQ